MKTELKTMSIELTRTIPATPAEVFDGWLDPKCPGTPWNMGGKVILDPKVDGLFYWLHVGETGIETPHYGRFTIVARPSKIEHTWMSIHTHGLESLVTVTFQKKGDDTVMTLRHENLPDDDHGKGHEQGWGYFMTEFTERFTSGRKQA